MPSSPHLPRAGLAAVVASAGLLLCGCSLLSSSPTPSGVATNPPGTPNSTGTEGTSPAGPSGSPTAAGQSAGTRTVLATLGLNMHSSPSLSAHVVGTLGWGSTVTVKSYDANGGPWPHSTARAWYQVQGATLTGWIVADPTLSASGTLESINFGDKHIDGLLYPADWTYADLPGEILLQPQSGSDRPSIAIRVVAGLSALGPPGITGYTPVTSDSRTVVCGYTGTEVHYSAPSGASATPTTDAGGGQVTRLASFVQFRASLQSSPPIAIDIEMNYSSSAQETVFANLLNSIRYPFPLCEAPAK